MGNRPKTDLNFLKLLEGKEHLLHTLATKDLTQNSLKSETTAATLDLANIKDRITGGSCKRSLRDAISFFTGMGRTLQSPERPLGGT